MKHILDPFLSKHHIYFEIAVREALKSEIAHKHGCVIRNQKSGKIMAKGHNKYTHRKCFKNYYSIHAEVDVINKCRSIDLKKNKVIMYIVRIGNNGAVQYSKPCVKCQKLLIKKKVTIYHS